MTDTPITIAGLLQRASQLESTSDTPRLDAELILSKALGESRTFLHTWPDQTVSPGAVRAYTRMLESRASGRPIAHLVGSKAFWTLDLAVNAHTLIPRPETELLVEVALNLGGNIKQVLDLGTGSGAIALALASARPHWHVDAVDIVAEAVELAEYNRVRLGIANVTVTQSDWFANIPGRKFDLIVSNPPYVDADDPHLVSGDVRFEPISALVAENQGLAHLDTIIRNANLYLAVGGWLLLEHGWQQGAAVRERLQSQGLSDVATQRDLNGHERLSLGRRC